MNSLLDNLYDLLLQTDHKFTSEVNEWYADLNYKSPDGLFEDFILDYFNVAIETLEEDR